MATKIIGTSSERISWHIKRADKGFEGFDFEFSKIDSEHTLVTIIFPKSLIERKKIREKLKKMEGGLFSQLIKLKGAEVSVNKSSIDFNRTSGLEFIITHPIRLKKGWEIKLGKNSAILGTSTSVDVFWSVTKRYSHYANGHYWVAFWDGGFHVLYSSPDNIIWTQRSSDLASGADISSTSDAAFRFVGTTIHVGIFSFGAKKARYRTVILNSDGTATLNALEIIFSTSFTREYHNFGVDSIGDIWFITGKGLATYKRSSASWISNGNSNLETGSGGRAMMLFDIELGNMLAINNYKTGQSSNEWDDTLGSWNVTPDDVPSGIHNVLGTQKWCAVKTADLEIHLVAIDFFTNGKIGHVKRTGGLSGTWSNLSTDVTGLATHTMLTLSSDGNDLYLFYDKSDNKIYYRKFDGTSWQSESILKSNLNVIASIITSYEQSVNSEIGITWAEGTVSPYDVVFETISIAGETPLSKTAASQIEAMGFVSALKTAGIESQASVTQTSTSSIESVQSVAQTTSGVIEFLAEVSKTAQAGYEALSVETPLSKTAASQIEAMGFVSALKTAGIESQASVTQTSTSSIESLQSVAQTASGVIEFLAEVSKTAQAGYESLSVETPVSKTAVSQIEAMGFVSALKTAGIESQASVIQTSTSSIESLQSVSKTISGLLELLAEVSRTAQASYEFLSVETPVSKTAVSQIEALGSVSVSKTAGIEFQGLVTQISTGSVESLQSVVQTASGVLESLTEVSKTAQAGYEALAGEPSVSKTAVSLFEARQRMEILSRTEYEYLQTVSKTAQVSIESLLGIEVQAQTQIESRLGLQLAEIVIERTGFFAETVEKTGVF